MYNKDKHFSVTAITDIDNILNNQRSMESQQSYSPASGSAFNHQPVKHLHPSDPCLPQTPTDDAVKLLAMDSTGPWASGHLDWSSLSGLTGTRPVVDKYSITRYSTGEWQKNNAITLQGDIFKDAKINNFLSQNKVVETKGNANKNFLKNSAHLKQRACDIFHWKSELERWIDLMAKEIVDLENDRQRLKQATIVLRIPAAISKECLDLRTTRLESDLVHDSVEEELIKENSLINTVNQYFERLIQEIEAHMTANKEAKRRLEFDWSDKKVSHDIETQNSDISTKSKTIFHSPGALRIPDGQSNVEMWNNFSKSNIIHAEETLRKSQNIRSITVATLINAARDLWSQSDNVNKQFSLRIAVTDETRIKFDDQLDEVLKKIVEAEKISDKLRNAIKVSGGYCSVAHTRMHNRNSIQRPNVENCRDPALWGLINEAKQLENGITALRNQWQSTQMILAELFKERAILEKEIAVKRKSVIIDRDRCGPIRSSYPSVVELSGY